MSSNDPTNEWRQLENALDELLDLDLADRPAALARWRTTHPELGEQLASFLRHAETEEIWLDGAAVNAVTPTEPAMPAARVLAEGVQVGSYRIIKLVGRGGSGEVYAAERADGTYQQQVALKILHFDAIERRDRFESERQILAGLEHPHIARLLDGGISVDGHPYMVMEFVDGLPLIAWCRKERLPLSARLDLFLQICDAVDYAHRHLVVHRDLKPANVFVTADQRVKVLDFGAAKLLATTNVDETRHAPFTPGYAAPEQLSGAPITTATDVYALGLLLFELLAGVPPFSFEKLSIAAALESALHREAPKLSEFTARSSDAPVLPRALRGDLDAIVERALRKVPAHRYPTVRELREDVLAHIEGRAVKSRGGAFLYRTGRTLKRHKMLAASVTVAVLALVAGAIGIERQSQLARAEARKEEAVKNFLLDVFRTNAVDNPDGVSARQTTAVQLLDRGAKAVSEDTKSSPEVRGEFIDELADLYDQLEDFGRVEQLERQRLKDLDREGGQPSLARAAALAELGRALTMNVRYPEARMALLEALSNLDSIHDESSPARTLALMTLGLLEYRVDPLKKDSSAARHTRAALDLLVKYRPDHPDRLTAVQLLARIDEQRGAFADAEAGYREFLRLVQTPAFGTERVALGSAYGDLADFLAARGRYDEAELGLRKSIEILDQAEGPDQANSVDRHLALAKIYIATHRDAEAEPILRKILDSGFQDVERAGLAHRAMGQLVDLDLSHWRLGEAETLLQKNRSFLLNNADADRDLQPVTAASWARLLMMQGRFDEASHAQAEAAALFATAVGGPLEAVRANEVLGGDIAVARGQWQEAQDRYRKVPPGLSSTYSAASARQSLGLGRVELHDGGPQQAMLRASEVLAQIEALPSGRRPLLVCAEAHDLAAGAAQAVHDYATAAVHLQEQISTLESLSAPKPMITSLRAKLSTAQRAITVKAIVPSSLPAAASATREL